MLSLSHFNGLCPEKKLCHETVSAKLMFYGLYVFWQNSTLLQAVKKITAKSTTVRNFLWVPRPHNSFMLLFKQPLTKINALHSNTDNKENQLSLTCSMTRSKDGRSMFQIPKQFYHLWRSCFLSHAHLLEQIHTLHPSTVSFTVWVVSNMKPGNKPEMRREHIEALSIYMFIFSCQQTKGASFLNSSIKCSSLCPSQDPCLQL